MIVLGAAILSIVATWIWTRVAKRLGLLDPPNPLIPQHRNPTAHMGGVAVALSAYLALALHSLWPTRGALVVQGRALVVLFAGMAFLLLGMLDDMLRLSARSKFAGQIVIALGAVAGGLSYPFFGFHWLDAAVSAFLILTVVNAVNLTDVCDGLVAGLAPIALIFASTGSQELAPWWLATVGACLGFLVFNAPPARVFLGDAGSHWLGFMLIAATLTMRPTTPPIVHAAVFALLCGVFLFELALLVVARASRGIPFWQGSPDHFSIRLQAAGLSRWATVALAWTAGGLLGWLALRVPAWVTAGAAWLLLPLLIGAVVLLGILLFTTHPPQKEALPPGAEPRRLLWIHQNFVSARQAGNSRAIHLVSALLEQGWQVDIVTTQAGYLDEPSRHDQMPFLVEREGRLSIHRFRNRAGPGHRLLSWVVFCTKALFYVGHFRRVDVVYASTPPLPQILLAALVSLVRRAPLVLEIRDLWPMFLERQGMVRSPLVLLAMEWVEAFAYRSARHCVLVSPAYAPFLSEMGIRREACTVAPTGVAAPQFDEGEGNQWRREHGLEGKFIVLYAGSFNESYDVDRLLRAAKRNASDGRIVWLFAGGGRKKPAVEEAAGLPGVRYLGSLERDSLWPVLQAADVGIVSLGASPILQLVVPGKLFDYCAARLPVICTVEGLAGAIVRTAGAGEVLREPSAERLADAIAGMVEQPGEAQRATGRRGYEWMSAHMSSARSARAIECAVDEVERRFGGQSQWLHLVGATAGALADVVTRRSRRAADRVLTPNLSERCEASLLAWLEASPERESQEAPLGIPALLTARS
jgi:UDP-GlcNAc:undecaprenyl-phosphate GlcNAc-1-phosphate transferase